jgi:hypothetical protein
MVKALGDLLVGWLQEILEVVGLVFVAVAVAQWAGWPGGLAVIGVGFLAKSLEVDLLLRKGGRS